MFRREVWDTGFRFDSRYDQIEDFEFWMRASREFQIAKLEAPPLLQFRKHGETGTAVHGAKMEILTAEVIAKYAEDRRDATDALADGYFNASYMLRKRGCRGQAIRYALKALRYKPLSPRGYKNLLGSLLNS